MPGRLVQQRPQVGVEQVHVVDAQQPGVRRGVLHDPGEVGEGPGRGRGAARTLGMPGTVGLGAGLQTDQPPAWCERVRLVQQAGPADAGWSGDEHAARPLTGQQDPADLLQFADPADEGRADGEGRAMFGRRRERGELCRFHDFLCCRTVPAAVPGGGYVGARRPHRRAACAAAGIPERLEGRGDMSAFAVHGRSAADGGGSWSVRPASRGGETRAPGQARRGEGDHRSRPASVSCVRPTRAAITQLGAHTHHILAPPTAPDRPEPGDGPFPVPVRHVRIPTGGRVE